MKKIPLANVCFLNKNGSTLYCEYFKLGSDLFGIKIFSAKTKHNCYAKIRKCFDGDFQGLERVYGIDYHMMKTPIGITYCNHWERLQDFMEDRDILIGFVRPSL